MSKKIVGPRMAELCSILLNHFDGEAPSCAALYMRLDYRGMSSNRYGSAALRRACRAGLISREPVRRNRYRGVTRYRVTITDAGIDAVTS